MIEYSAMNAESTLIIRGTMTGCSPILCLDHFYHLAFSCSVDFLSCELTHTIKALSFLYRHRPMLFSILSPKIDYTSKYKCS